MYSELLTIAQNVAENVIMIDNFRLLRNNTAALIRRSCQGELNIAKESLIFKKLIEFRRIQMFMCTNVLSNSHKLARVWQNSSLHQVM